MNKKGEASIIKTQNEAITSIKNIIESLKTIMGNYESLLRDLREEKAIMDKVRTRT